MITDPFPPLDMDEQVVPETIGADVGVGIGPRPRVWPWTRVLLWLIHGYQRAMEGRPSPCRFTPSCSTYATEALRIHGLLKGSFLAVWRLLRCNPWGGQGFDPVPGMDHRRSSSCSPARSHQHHNHNKAN